MTTADYKSQAQSILDAAKVLLSTNPDSIQTITSIDATLRTIEAACAESRRLLRPIKKTVFALPKSKPNGSSNGGEEAKVGSAPALK